MPHSIYAKYKIKEIYEKLRKDIVEIIQSIIYIFKLSTRRRKDYINP